MIVKDRPTQVFYSYAREDEALLADLNAHLSLLIRQSLISTWSDRAIEPGHEWDRSIMEYLARADIILLMISSNFIESDFCWSNELKKAMERHDHGSARVIPVIIRPCDWKSAPFGKLQVLPSNGVPVTRWPDKDAAWLEVAKGIRNVITNTTCVERPPELREPWELTINATLEELDASVINQVQDLLRKISGDVELTIRAVKKNSIVLEIDLTAGARRRLENLIDSKELIKLIGFEIIRYGAGGERLAQIPEPVDLAAKLFIPRIKPLVHLGTIGHTGHGKTTLTAAITRVLNKRADNVTPVIISSEAMANRLYKGARDISEHSGRIEYATENRHYSHVDYATHADFVKNMITGAAQLDGAILVVSASDGPMPQTREQILLARQVGVPAMVVFMNKMDVVNDPSQLDLVELEVRELLSAYDFPGDEVPVVRGSAWGALKGEERWEKAIKDLMAAVDSYIPTPEHDIEKPFLMSVEEILTVPGKGTLAKGRIERGIVHVNEVVEIVGVKDKTSTSVVTSVEMFGKHLAQGKAGDNVELLLKGVERRDIERGQVIAKPGSITLHTKFKAEAYILTKEEGGRHTPFFTGYRPQFYFRTTDVTGVAQLPEGVETVMPGDNVAMEVELYTPVAIEKGLRFVIREGDRTVGTGTITDIVERAGGDSKPAS